MNNTADHCLGTAQIETAVGAPDIVYIRHENQMPLVFPPYRAYRTGNMYPPKKLHLLTQPSDECMCVGTNGGEESDTHHSHQEDDSMYVPA